MQENMELENIETEDIEMENIETENIGSENMEVQESERQLETLAGFLTYIQQVVPIDCALTVTDTEKYRYLLSGEKIKIPNEVLNTKVPENDSPYQAVHTGRNAVTMVPAQQLGFPYESTSTPIRDEAGNIIGALGLAIGLGNREILLDNVNTVVSSSEETLATVEELAASAEQLSVQENNLAELIRDILSELNNTKDILKIINTVANTSNILGLNASIEAARAGETGKGFAVVATEIRKMSKDSSEGVKKIESILAVIKAKVEDINQKITETSIIATQQAAATEEISNAMQELATSSEQLKNASENVIG